MGIAESPVMTDADEIKAKLDCIANDQAQLQTRLDNQAQGINAIGANLQWLVDNVQGIFQMFASPQFAQQMMQMIGGAANGGQDGPDATGDGPQS